jgi:hypothetical protein
MAGLYQDEIPLRRGNNQMYFELKPLKIV